MRTSNAFKLKMASKKPFSFIFGFVGAIIRSLMYLVFATPFFCFGQAGSSITNPIELGYVTSYMPQGYLVAYFPNQYVNVHGAASPDIVHKFAVTGNTSLDVLVYTSASSKVYLLDGQFNQISVNDFTPSSSYQNLSITAGTYYLVFEPGVSSPNEEAVIEMSLYVHDNIGLLPATTGTTRMNPIVVPNNPDGSIDFNDLKSFDPLFAYGDNHAAGAYDDIYYRFELPQATNIKALRKDVYFNGSYSLHILNSSGSNIFSTTTYDGTIDLNLDGGVYYLVVDGEGIGAGGNYNINLKTSPKPSEGIGLTDAILVGNYTLGGSYSYHDNRSNGSGQGYGNEMGQPSDDIYYKLIVNNTATVSASLCGSDFDTFLYLLNASGTVLKSNNNSGPLCSGSQSSLLSGNLAAGTYYIVAEGNGSASGNINLYVSTDVQGSPDPVVNLLPISVTTTENYVLERKVLADNITTAQQLASLPRNSIRAEVTYYDGLGRPSQHIAIGASPTAKDIVTPIGYDQFGREDKLYLPYEAASGGNSASGSMRANALTKVYTNSAQYQFYQQASTSIPKIPNPYTQMVFESSPLNRVVETASPGKEWEVGKGHTVGMAYSFNVSNEVRKWSVTSSGSLNNGASTGGQYYSVGQLYKHIVNDEQGNTTIEYTDKEGKVVSKKVQDGGSTASPTYATTDYIYDGFGNLAYVVPPALETLSSFTEADDNFSNYIYAYHYDGRGRLTEKKIPGSGWTYIVYNTADKPVYVQDASHRSRSGGAVWLFTKYDRLGRVIITGEIKSGQSRQALQNTLNSSQKPVGTLQLYESRNNTQQFGYTAASLPVHTGAGVSVFTVNYYDRYDFLDIPIIASKPVISSFRVPDGSALESNQANGLPTASLTRILGTTDFLLTETIYDQKGRIRAVLAEHQLNGVDETTNSFNFASELKSVNRKHYKNTALQLTLDMQLSYDHAGRTIAVTEQVNQQTPSITKYIYNALGQLEVKKAGNRSTIRAYNARGSLAKSASPLFSFSLLYDKPADMAKAQYSGNISEQIWITGNERTPHRYSYAYDRANRLQSGIGSGGYGETLTYDKMGNINSLVRTGLPQLPGGAGSFSYNYGSSGHKLQNVSDGNSYSRNFQYNSIGSVSADGQLKIMYNELNLPNQITDNNNVPKVSYLYNALGSKLTKHSPMEVRQYINGIEYIVSGSNATIDLIHASEGVLRKRGTTYHYEYLLKDHLGNTRVVYNGNGEVLQQTDYLPFGLEINRKLTSPKLDYTYNGKELQDEVRQYDYGARFYDPIIGRWSAVDRMAEVYASYSPYAYVGNDPILYHDPNGMYRMDDNGNMIIQDEDEIQRIYKFLNNNGKATISDVTNYVISADNGFSWELDAVSVEGRTSFKSGEWLNAAQGRVSDAVGLMGNINGVNLRGGIDFSNSKLALDIGGGIYGAMETAVRHGDQWLGKNGKYYSNSWGGNQHTGSRSGAFKAANRYKLAGGAMVVATAALGGIETYNGYQKDGRQFGYNAQSAAAQTIGGIGGGVGGGALGAKIGAGIGVWFGGVGVVPGAVIGGFVGSLVGGTWGSSAGQGAVNLYHGR